MLPSQLNMSSGSALGEAAHAGSTTRRTAGAAATVPRASHPPRGLRNPPRQPRSRRRLERLLAAAAEVLGAEGPQALTTRRVAETAGVPIGSLYRFFADKHAIVEALALAWWRELVELVAAVAELDELEPLADPVGAVIEVLSAGMRARPAFLALWYGGLRDERLRDATRPLRAQFAAAVQRILASHWPAAADAERAAAAEMAVLAGDGLLR